MNDVSQSRRPARRSRVKLPSSGDRKAYLGSYEHTNGLETYDPYTSFMTERERERAEQSIAKTEKRGDRCAAVTHTSDDDGDRYSWQIDRAYVLWTA